ncbi:MAG: DUF4012 domain-containing protein [Parcubacteria group bacterium]
MIVRALDGVRAARIEYPDLSDLLVQVEQPKPKPLAEKSRAITVVQPQRAQIARPRQKAKTSPRKLRVVKRGIVRSGFSWFLVCAVLSASAIGLFSVFENGRAAKAVISEQALSAGSALVQATGSLAANDTALALSQFDQASASFESVSQSLTQLSASVRTAAILLPGDPLGSADKLARAGVHVATAGRALTAVVTDFGGVDLSGSTSGSGQTLTEALTKTQPGIHTVSAELSAAAALVAEADPRGLPGDLPATLTTLQQQLPGVLEQLSTLDGLVGVLAEVAGATQARTYAVVFQNPNELRPTGGFWGQLAFVKVQKGRVEKLDVKSIYDPAGQVSSHQTPPEGLDVISEEFKLQDVNWFHDFPTSARVLLSFLSETGDPRLDGVIALNPSVVTSLLALTGPLTIDPLGLTITEDNFSEEAQYEVPDKDPERERSFFPTLAEQLLARMFSLDRAQWLELAGTLTRAVEHKDIQIFFGDAALATLPATLEADGVLPAGSDLVAPIIANVGGGKTDQYINESRLLRILVGQEYVRHELEITRRDTRTDQFKDRDNRSYLRTYVPEGAILREARGFDTDLKALVAHKCGDCEAAVGTPVVRNEKWDAASNTRQYVEEGYTVFANWITLTPGEEQTVKLVYDVPLSAISDGKILKLHIWRQSGATDIPLDLEVQSDGKTLTHVSGATRSGDKFVQRLVLERDHVIGVLLE